MGVGYNRHGNYVICMVQEVMTFFNVINQ